MGACKSCCMCCCPCCFKVVQEKTTYIPLDSQSKRDPPKQKFRWLCALITTIVVIGASIGIFYPILNFIIVPPVGKQQIKNGNAQLKNIKFDLQHSSLLHMKLDTNVKLQMMTKGSPVAVTGKNFMIKAKNQDNKEFANIKVLKDFTIPSGANPMVMMNTEFQLTNGGNLLRVVWGLFTGKAMIKADINGRVRAIGGYVNAKVMGTKNQKLPSINIGSLISKLIRRRRLQTTATSNLCNQLPSTCSTSGSIISLNASGSGGDVQFIWGNATFHVYPRGASRSIRNRVAVFSTQNFNIQKGISSCQKGNIVAHTRSLRTNTPYYMEGPVDEKNRLNMTHPDGYPQYLWNTSKLIFG